MEATGLTQPLGEQRDGSPCQIVPRTKGSENGGVRLKWGSETEMGQGLLNLTACWEGAGKFPG